MTIVFDLLTRIAVVSFSGAIIMPGPFANQSLKTKAGEKHCRERGWDDRKP